ncbi:hypothetical protein ABGB09_33960 [Streptomyces sp. B8F3]|uniref:hypothetical protein n=1 Tax=Streptomyces sp. B8F3 TaxID=3153573 RepID=UPI00325CC9ED
MPSADFDDDTASEGARLALAVERLARELPRLLPDKPELRAAVETLLARMRTETPRARDDTLDTIGARLTAHPRARQRLNQLLGPTTRADRAGRLPGDPFVEYDRLVCPRCRRVWVILGVDDEDDPPERCPDDSEILTDLPGGGTGPP